MDEERQDRGDLYSPGRVSRGSREEEGGRRNDGGDDKGEGIERDNDKALDNGALEEGVPSFTGDEG
jgi:hypothetical protein